VASYERSACWQVYTFDSGNELAFPIREEDRDGVIIVRVLNENVRFGKKPALIGQARLSLSLSLCLLRLPLCVTASLHLCCVSVCVSVYDPLPASSAAAQWFMTIKYLLLFPTYCKRSAIKVLGNSHIRGTFLLSDAKLRGSAVRALGPSDLGRGFSGELDMELQWTHTANIDAAPPRKLLSATDQARASQCHAV